MTATVLARRASAILFGVLQSRSLEGPILLPANVCAVVPITIRETGRQFELIDIDPHSLAISPGRTLERVRRGRCAGIIFVRPYGSLRDADSLFAELKALQPDLLVLDDRCLSRPDCDPRSVSPHADVTLFSTGRAKYADLGSGGFAHLRDDVPWRRPAGAFDPAAADAVERLPKDALARGACFGGAPPGWLDLREPELTWDPYRARVEAELLRVDAMKERMNAIYRAEIPEEVQLPPDLCTWRFNLRVPRAEELLRTIFAQGLFASRHFPPVGPLFGDERAYPAAAALHAEIVNLFNDRYFDEEKALRAARLVREHLGR